VADTPRRYSSPATAVAPVAGPAAGRRLLSRYGDAIATAALLSFRLGGTDGVAVEAAKWRDALGVLGFATYTVAGSGPVDVTVPGLAIDAPDGPTAAEVEGALAGADLVIVENLCSLPLNPVAAAVVGNVLAGRPAVLHHHDLPWQRPQFVDHPPPPDDPCWRHVTINELSRGALAERGIRATTVYNSFTVPPGGAATGDDAPAHRSATARAVRDALGVGPGDRLVLQPTRALARKNVGGGLAAAARLGATFWLLGPAEDGFGPQLDRLIAGAQCPVVLGLPGPHPTGAVPATASGNPPAATPGTTPGAAVGIDDCYQACDVVALPSTWEGFGNPSLESVTHRRPLAIGPYPVARELASFGFDWFGLDDLDRLDAWLADPEPGLFERNLAVARAHFSLDGLPGRIAAVLPDC
jgi:glycosyltransferase involved in cell wall biosynthesis